MQKRDYSLLGAEAAKAEAAGLAAAHWYHTDVTRDEMRALMQRSDHPAIRDTVLLFGSMILLAGFGIALWPSWWGVPFWLVYGVLYGSAMDSRWHECGHGTAFKTRWMNRVVYQVACFCMIRNPVIWKNSHVRHHTDTIIVGRDPEILAMQPPAIFMIAVNFFGVMDVWHGLRKMLLNASGQIDAQDASFIPDAQLPQMIFVARVWCAIYAAVIILAVVMGSILPLMVIGLPRLYGAWHHVLTGLLQHTGLAEDVLDHRLNTRTVFMNPVSRFIYWNMNYHIEHHMFPMVPFHRLPDLHARIKDDLPAPSPSILAALAEITPVLKRQLRGEAYHLRRDLPPSARPYREDLHQEVPAE